MEYELLFFTSVANEEKAETIKRELVEILGGFGAKILGEFTDIGKRKLAHPIKRNTHAFFSFARFELNDEGRQNIPEIGKRIGLYDKVMRHIIVRADEIGKPHFLHEARKQEVRPEPSMRKIEVLQKKTEPKETKPKASLSELDEKLTEILEESPE